MNITSEKMIRAEAEQYLSWVSPKVGIQTSSIQGRGLYAKEHIEKDEIIVVQSGQIIEDHKMDQPMYGEVAEIAFQIEKGFHICPVCENRQFVVDGIFIMNHSCDPNCGVKGQITFVAIRSIEAGEEITFDYAMTDANYPDMQCTPISPMSCTCGAANCRKVISGEDWKQDRLQKKYKGYFSNYIQQMIERATP